MVAGLPGLVNCSETEQNRNFATLVGAVSETARKLCRKPSAGALWGFICKNG